MDVAWLIGSLEPAQQARFESAEFEQNCSDQFREYDKDHTGVLSADALKKAVLQMLPAEHRLMVPGKYIPTLAESIADVVNIFKKERATGTSFTYSGKDQIAERAFPDFVRFCQAWRVFQYFHTPQVRRRRARRPGSSMVCEAHNFSCDLPPAASDPSAETTGEGVAGLDPKSAAVIAAAEAGDAIALRELINGWGQGRAEVDQRCRTAEGSTPLMKAAWGGHDACVGALLEFGSVVDSVDLSGQTAIFYALIGCESAVSVEPRQRCMELLARAGADMNLVVEGCTPLSLAEWKSQDGGPDPGRELARVLEELGAKDVAAGEAEEHAQDDRPAPQEATPAPQETAQGSLTDDWAAMLSQPAAEEL